MRQKNVGNTVVLARIFNEVRAQKMPSRMVRLILSEYLYIRIQTQDEILRCLQIPH
jgi:hypothetical protein